MDDKESAQEPSSSWSSRSIDLNPMTEFDVNDGRRAQKLGEPSAAQNGSSGTIPSRKGRACLACRKLKVKCDSAERGLTGCSRCQRLGLECVSTRPLMLAADSEGELKHPAIARLDRAVEDILRKLDLPPLKSYSQPVADQHDEPTRIASASCLGRESSLEPTNNDDIAPAPMGSLFEVTQLKSLHNHLRKPRSNQQSSRRKSERDLIAQNVISGKDAEELFELYKRTLGRYLWAVTVPEDMSLTALRGSSTLLFTAVMLVSAIHIPGKEGVHAVCHKEFLDLISKTIFERFHTLDDIRALCIAAFWQPDLSWKLSGLCIRMATELNIHQAFYSAFYSKTITEDHRKIALEKVRTWYLLYVLDHHFSIAYGRPPVTAELLPIKEHDVFVNSPWCTSSDRRLISQVSIFVILSRAFEVFGLESERVMESDDATLLVHARFTEDISIWRQKWRQLLSPDKFIGDYPVVGTSLHYHFASLLLGSLALRGRALESLATLPQSLRPIALNAIEAAHSILQFFLDERSYRDGLVGIPLYFHSMIAFAIVFLIKLSHRWSAIGISIDPDTRTKPLIQGIISTLRQCKGGANHMIFSMASGFERMLETSWATDVGRPSGHTRASSSRKRPTDDHHKRGQPESKRAKQSTSHTKDQTSTQSSPGANVVSSDPAPPSTTTGPMPMTTQEDLEPVYSTYPDPLYTPQPSSANGSHGQNGTVSFEDDMLWSTGMGYDLLHPNRYDFLFGDPGFGLGSDGPDLDYYDDTGAENGAG